MIIHIVRNRDTVLAKDTSYLSLLLINWKTDMRKFPWCFCLGNSSRGLGCIFIYEYMYICIIWFPEKIKWASTCNISASSRGWQTFSIRIQTENIIVQ